MRTYDTQQFITKATNHHGNKYDYSKVSYVNSKQKVIIICPVHGEFKQHAARHLIGHGCKRCKDTTVHKWTASSTEKFVDQATKKHCGKYDYSATIYTKSSIKVQIICPKHGIFEQTPNKHLAGTGCKKCSKSGFSNKANNWLTEIECILNRPIIGAHRTREYHISNTRYHVDGYDEITNTVYEFYGDKWHGNLKVYNRDDKCHPFNNHTAGELYDRTLTREHELRSLGYNIVSMWEYDYDSNKRKINDN